MRLGLYLRSARDHIRRAEISGLAHKAARLFYSDNIGIVVRKDLTGDAGSASRMREPQVRPASSADIQALVGADGDETTDADELWQRRLRRHIADDLGVDGCFVADLAGGGPCFMLYLFTAADNDRLRSAFPGLFPVMAADESIMEFLYVALESRNLGLTVDCILQVADEARRRGATSVTSFIDPANKGALFVDHLAGFEAQSVRRSRRRFFRKTYSFEPLPPGWSRALIDLAGDAELLP